MIQYIYNLEISSGIQFGNRAAIGTGGGLQAEEGTPVCSRLSGGVPRR